MFKPTMHSLNLKSLLCVALWALACGGAGSDDDALESAGLKGGHDTTLTSQQTLGLADQLFDFDPTLDVSKSAELNAQAIRTRAQTTMACATVMLSGTTVTVSAPPPGCTGANGVAFSGTVSVAVTRATSSLTLGLTFTSVVLGSAQVSGTMTMVTSNNTTFQVTYALTDSGKSVSGNVTATGAPGQLTITGTLNSEPTAVTFTSVVWKKGDCYPSAGTASVSQGRVTTAYTFSSSTPATGLVTTGRGRSVALPAYGSCPAPDGGR
jgi:hypothetical protein